MTTKSWLLALLLTSLVSIAWSKETNVPPGVGTLPDAIAAASDGDTLILGWGTYRGGGGGSDQIIINKSLTIRPVNRSTESVIFSNNFVIEGSGISVVLQGLRFSSTNFYINQAAQVKILENNFVATNIYAGNYRTDQGDGSLFIIGNNFLTGSIYNISSDDSYIAGNVLNDGYISSFAGGWIIGNDVTNRSFGCINAIGIDGAHGVVQVIANRVTFTHQCGPNYSSGIYVNASLALVAGNIVQLNCQQYVYYNNSYCNANGISTYSGYVTIINNIIYGDNFPGTYSDGKALEVNIGNVFGNIIYNNSLLNPISSTSSTVVTNNLCFNNKVNCNTANGNLNADPKFVDLVNFRLAPDSPAINAGPTDFAFADLDRTRNDMGVYGGPWSIAQYDAQRTSGNLAPYVYPLFKASSSYSGGGLDIRALGVARLR